MRALTEQWMEEVTATVAREADLPEPITDTTRTIKLTVDRSTAPSTVMHLRIDPTSISLLPGQPDHHDVELACSSDTMRQLCRRETTAGDAFRSGQITLTGDIDALTGLDEAFDEIVWAMGAVPCDGW